MDEHDFIGDFRHSEVPDQLGRKGYGRVHFPSLETLYQIGLATSADKGDWSPTGSYWKGFAAAIGLVLNQAECID